MSLTTLKPDISLPVEIWFQILKYLSYDELKLFRLVSITLRTYGTHAFQKLNRYLVLSTTQNVQDFLPLIRNSISTKNLFSKFQISCTNVTPEFLALFAKEISEHVTKYRLPEPKEFNGQHKDEKFHISYTKCLTTLLNNAPKLKSLKLMAFDYRVPKPAQIKLPQVFLFLEKVWIRLEFKFGSNAGDIFISQLIKRSPRLKKLYLHHSSQSIGLETTDNHFFVKLSDYCKLLPLECKLGLLLENVSDNVKDVLTQFMSTKFQLCLLWIYGYEFKTLETFELFWNWVTIQPIKKICLATQEMKITEDMKSTLDLFPIPLEYCQKLRLNGILQHNFKFPNVREVNLREGTAEIFKSLAIAVPQLERLLCKFIDNPWKACINELTGANDALEVLIGVRKYQIELQSPLNEFKRLKMLDLEVNKEGLKMIFFLSALGLITKLQSLNLRVLDPNDLQDGMLYKGLLLKFHSSVNMMAKEATDMLWWHSY